MCVDLPVESWLISDNRQINRLGVAPGRRFTHHLHPTALSHCETSTPKPFYSGRGTNRSLLTSFPVLLGHSNCWQCWQCWPQLASHYWSPGRPVGPEIKLETSPRNPACLPTITRSWVTMSFPVFASAPTNSSYGTMSLCLG